MWMEEGNRQLARCKFHFIREHKNLVNDPSNNVFIVISLYFKK